MQKCKWCDFMFDDDLGRCPECGTKVKRKKAKAEFSKEKIETAFLCNAADPAMLSILLSMLDEAGIVPEVRSGGYYTGISVLTGGNPAFGSDIFVPASDLDTALHLLDALEAELPDEAGEGCFEPEDTSADEEEADDDE